jgi:hypothetical protein
VVRLNTNTPLQALILLNDPQVLEAARVLAEKLSVEKITEKEKIEKAFRVIICRKAKAEEKEILLSYYEKEKIKYKQLPGMAESLLKAGEYKHETVTDKAATAALMMVVQTIYNMEEAITKS